MLDSLSILISQAFPEYQFNTGGGLRSDKILLESVITKIDINKHIISGNLSKNITDQLLNYFVENKYYDFATLLLDNGADPNACLNDISVIARSTQGGNLEMVKLLLEKGAFINLTDVPWTCGWMSVPDIQSGGIPYGTENFNEDKFDDITTDYFFNNFMLRNPLSIAVVYGHFEIVKLLVDNNADIVSNESILRYSVLKNRYEIFKFLLGRGAKINNNGSILIDAVARKNIEIVKLLLVNGTDVHAFDDTALLNSAKLGQTDIVKLLLENGANIHCANDNILPLSIRFGFKQNISMVKLLLENGANVHAQDNYALVLSSHYGFLETTKLLLQYGANVHAHDNTALKLSMQRNNLEMVKVLLDYGAKQV